MNRPAVALPTAAAAIAAVASLLCPPLAPSPQPSPSAGLLSASAQGGHQGAGSQVAGSGSRPSSPQLLASLSPQPATTSNWAGYVATGHSFVGVTGTFAVPMITHFVAGATVSEWVGVDGWSNNDLIQAGVNEIPVAPGKAIVEPWWEVLPATQQLANGMMVRSGDLITVSIREQTGASWSISLIDHANGDRFKTTCSYSGALSSAEWIVEADEDPGGSPTTLSPFAPNIAFANLSADGPASTLEELQMLQGGNAVSQPSTFNGRGFSVAYLGHPATT